MCKKPRLLDVVILRRELTTHVLGMAIEFCRSEKLNVLLLYREIKEPLTKWQLQTLALNGRITFVKDSADGIDHIINRAVRIATSDYITFVGDDEYRPGMLKVLVSVLENTDYDMYFLNGMSENGVAAHSPCGENVLTPAALLSEVQTDIGFISSLIFKRTLLENIDVPDEIYGTNWIIMYYSAIVLQSLQEVYLLREPVFVSPRRELTQKTWYDMIRTHSFNLLPIYYCTKEGYFKMVFKLVLVRKIKLTLLFNAKSRLKGFRTGMADKLKANKSDFIRLCKFSVVLLPYYIFSIIVSLFGK